MMNFALFRDRWLLALAGEKRSRADSPAKQLVRPPVLEAPPHALDLHGDHLLAQPRRGVLVDLPHHAPVHAAPVGRGNYGGAALL